MMKATLSIIASFAVVSTTACFASGDMAPVETEETTLELKAENFFIYGSIGSTKTEVISSSNQGTQFVENTDDSAGYALEGGIGYRYSDHVFATVFVNGTDLEEATITNYNASLNFRMADFAVTPYVGAVLGYSMFEWKDKPAQTVNVAGVINSYSPTSAHLGMGLQGGVEYMMPNNMTLFGKYQYMNHDHFTEVYQTSKYEHTNTSTFQGGVRYEF
jgi:opacity protein-like surface antigen